MDEENVSCLEYVTVASAASSRGSQYYPASFFNVVLVLPIFERPGGLAVRSSSASLQPGTSTSVLRTRTSYLKQRPEHQKTYLHRCDTKQHS
jgi:hypothetical protein